MKSGRVSAIALTAAIAAVLLWPRRASASTEFVYGDNPVPENNELFYPKDLAPSAQLLDMLKQSEGLSLVRYELGDGGYTIGYGRYFPMHRPPPVRISQETADNWFFEDVETKGAANVRQYVNVPLLQQQFDALVHMAFNLSPRSFRQIAGAVNRGEDPESYALRFVLVGSDLERGLRNRRAKEMALYRYGEYA
jgi:lysozyme